MIADRGLLSYTLPACVRLLRRDDVKKRAACRGGLQVSFSSGGSRNSDDGSRDDDSRNSDDDSKDDDSSRSSHINSGFSWLVDILQRVDHFEPWRT
jgi:hypothetical protein